MGIKIEWVLLIITLIIISGSFNIKLNDTAGKTKPETKELEFNNTTFTEVDTHKLQGRAYGTHGIRDSGTLTVYNLKYHTDSIDSLVAKKGRYIGKTLYLEGDVILHQKEGYNYKTQQAEYNQETEVLNITAPFVATKERTIIRGDTLTYNVPKEEAYGTMIDATLYTVEK